jgi:hypothetical protein
MTNDLLKSSFFSSFSYSWIRIPNPDPIRIRIHNNHSQILVCLDVKNDGADFVGDGPGKHIYNFEKILSQESMR